MKQMRKNKLIYAGVLIAAGAALLWLGAVILARLKDIFPWIALVGLVLIGIGVFWEMKKNQEPKEASEEPAG